MAGKIKAQICSDLHLRHWDTPIELPGGEVLFLAGDVFDSATTNSFSDSRVQKFLDNLLKYEVVYYVPGNHEHYGLTIAQTYEHLRKFLPPNVHVFENDWTTLGDYSIFSGTLWTDMNKKDETTMAAARLYMPDFQIIRNNDETTLTPLDSVAYHYKCLSALRSGLQGKEKVIVMTHHAPSYRSVHERFLQKPSSDANGAFVTDLDKFIYEHPQIKLWIHGHTHDTFDYNIGECRILCNPRGYPAENNPFPLLELEL